MHQPRPDQRRHRRFPVRFRSSFSSVNLVGGEGSLVDLSVRGCRVQSQTTVLTGTALLLQVHLQEETVPLEIGVAVVRWTRDGTFGVEFVDMKDAEWQRLCAVIARLEQPRPEGLDAPSSRP